jgi:hypothetical protein
VSGRRRLAGIAAVLALMGAYAAWRWVSYIDAQQPAFIDLPAGPRAPSLDAVLGLVLTKSTVEQTKAAAAGLTCVDRSISTLMRDGLARAVTHLEERGENAWRYRLYGWLNPHGRNPQVRWDCALPDGSALGLPAELEEGRVLFVHDAPGAALRHVSIQRTWHGEAAVRADVAASLDRLAKRYGLPEPGTHAAEFADAGFAEVTPYAWEWRWTDVRVELGVVAYPGGRSVVTETIEVPWPVRSELP